MKSTMMFIYSAVACILLLSASQADAQCTAMVLNKYRECVANNPCECSACDPDPTDDDPILTVERPEDCLDVARIFCPLIRCCSLCEDEALGWFQCTANGFSSSLLDGQTCPLSGSCGSYALQDADCSPTMAPVVTPMTEQPVVAEPQETLVPTPGTNEDTSEPTSEPTQSPRAAALTDTMPPTAESRNSARDGTDTSGGLKSFVAASAGSFLVIAVGGALLR